MGPGPMGRMGPSGPMCPMGPRAQRDFQRQGQCPTSQVKVPPLFRHCKKKLALGFLLSAPLKCGGVPARAKSDLASQSPPPVAHAPMGPCALWPIGPKVVLCFCLFPIYRISGDMMKLAYAVTHSNSAVDIHKMSNFKDTCPIKTQLFNSL